MKHSLLGKIGVAFLTGSLLALVPSGSAVAADHDLYDSLKELTDSVKSYRSSDIYESMEPTASGMQGPVRTDMMKDYDTSYSSWSQWTDLRQKLGPVGGEGTN
mgnify:CR=1 FL=1